jgi:hypothetical protein
MRNRRPHPGAAVALGVLFLGGCTCNDAAPPPPSDPPPGMPATVVLVVLDTVRADHTSVCGYDRPTTPTLERLASDGVVSCAVKATSNWTVPSHASLFTGLHVVDHGTGLGRDQSQVDFGVRPLAAGEGAPETLAERFGALGYQTALVSANGLVGPETGLSRGYDTVHIKSIGKSQDDWTGPQLAERVQEVLAERSNQAPLFLTINILDAHDPWEPVPGGLDWVPPRQTLQHHRMRDRIDERKLRGPRREKALEHVRDLYDYGVYLADQRVAEVLDVLDDGGWRDGSWRLVVTSDHGEFLGEHDRLLHNGAELYEPVVSVPLVYADSEGAQPDIPSPASLLVGYELTLSGEPGELSEDVRAQHLSASPLDELSDIPCTDVTAARWEGPSKVLCMEGSAEVFDLVDDPEERNPARFGLTDGAATPDSDDSDGAGLVDRLRDDVDALEALNRSTSEAASVTDQLRELGYIE